MPVDTTNTAPASRSDRPRTRIGKPFPKGNPGRPRGVKDYRTRAGIEIADAMSGEAAEELRALLKARSPKIRFEVAKAILLWSWGAPKQSLTIAGVGDLAKEVSLALAAVRERRAALDAVVPAQALLGAPEALPELPAMPVTEAEK